MHGVLQHARRGRVSRIQVVQLEGHAQRHLHAGIAACRHRAFDDGIGGGGTVALTHALLLQVDQADGVLAVVAGVVVVVGLLELEGLTGAIGLDQADVGDVEAEVLDLHGTLLRAQLRRAGAIDLLGTVVGGELDAHVTRGAGLPGAARGAGGTRGAGRTRRAAVAGSSAVVVVIAAAGGQADGAGQQQAGVDGGLGETFHEMTPFLGRMRMDGNDASENGDSQRTIRFALANPESDQTTDKRSRHARDWVLARKGCQCFRQPQQAAQREAHAGARAQSDGQRASPGRQALAPWQVP